ncbi:hypothetical protein EV182_007756, partial [Spiromyces aspiralis]
MILSNRTPGDKAAIIGIGDRLRASGHTVPAHICYLATDSSSIFFPRPGEEHRVSLLGTEWKSLEAIDLSSLATTGFAPVSPLSTAYFRDFLSLRMTEMAELVHAMRIDSLEVKDHANGPSTGAGGRASGCAGGSMQNKPKVYCLPHLQAYKLFLAWWLIDLGELQLASRYCDTITGILESVPKGVRLPFIGKPLVEQLLNLRERLDACGIATGTKTGGGHGWSTSGPSGWLQKALPKPSFATLLSAFDSSIDKFITGE